MGMTTLLTKCEYCGFEFTRSKTHPHQRFCAESCARSWWQENKRKAHKKYCFVCMNCKRTYWTIYPDRNQYCSRECAFEADAGVYRCEVCGKKIKKNETYCSKECKSSFEHVCPQCDQKFLGSKRAVHCSDECIKESLRIKAYKYYVSVKETNPYVKKVCANCGEEFEINFNAYRILYCSKKCLDKALRSTKNAKARLRKYQQRKSAASVERVYRARIIERDHSICQICGKVIDMQLKFPDRMSLSFDHIIPLAKGGEHKPDNVQLAHFICNSYKRDLLPGDIKISRGIFC